MTEGLGLGHCFEMITPTNTHLIFDLLAWSTGVTLVLAQRKYFPEAYRVLIGDLKLWRCRAAIVGGATIGYFLFGQTPVLDPISVSHGLAGAWIGALGGLEIFRQSQGQSNSVLAILILPLAVGIAITRAGCHQVGLADPLQGIWIDPGISLDKMYELKMAGAPVPHPFYAINFGDGYYRYPVALFESLLMWLIAGAFWLWIVKRPRGVEKFGAPVFLLLLAAEKFALHFLTPFWPFVGRLSIFHWECLGLMVYALILFDQRASEPALSIKPESTE